MKNMSHKTSSLQVDDYLQSFNGRNVESVSDLKLDGDAAQDVECTVLRADPEFDVCPPTSET